jgi:hypothetical protein
MDKIKVHHNKIAEAFELQTNEKPAKLVAAVFHQKNDARRLNLNEAEKLAHLFAAAPALLAALKIIADGDASSLVQYCIDHHIDLTGIYVSSTIRKMIAIAAAALAEKEG